MKKKSVVSTIALTGMLLSGLSAPARASTMATNTIAANTTTTQVAAAQVTAQRLAQRSAQRRLARDNTPRPRNGGFVPRTDGTPGRTHSGASRRPELPGQCGGLALLPEDGGGLTIHDQLSLYVYFAEGTMVDQAILSLKSPDESEYYEADLNLPTEAFAKAGGVMEVVFPDMTPKLTIDETYTWSLVLKCNGQLRPDSPILGGAIRRILPDVTVQADASLSEKAQAYGDAGLWYDVLETLAVMRLENPGSTQAIAHWSSVLETVGLDVIADAPLITQSPMPQSPITQ